jgi:hypothetical protein
MLADRRDSAGGTAVVAKAGRVNPRLNRAALLAGVAGAPAEHDEASPSSDEERLTLAVAEIQRIRTEFRLEQTLRHLERAADDLRNVAEQQAEHSEHLASLANAARRPLVEGAAEGVKRSVSPKAFVGLPRAQDQR